MNQRLGVKHIQAIIAHRNWQAVANPAEFSTSIPQEMTRRGGLLRITLKIPKATSPKALGMSADPRILGVACFDLQLALKAG
jgi:hypothetical protein